MKFTDAENYMSRAISLAAKGLGSVSPNPLVGAVLVHENQIIGEGYHETFGGPHAEVNAIASVKNPTLISESTLYVNLEPCSHFGKTPPCANLIVEKKIKRIVISNLDPFPEVSGRGINVLVNAGVDVTTGVLEKEGCELNKRFFTFYKKNRPYIILKWAQTADGYMAPHEHERGKPLQISNSDAQELLHKWRSEEQAILVGKNTIINDDPQLNVRLVKGNNPKPFILGSQHGIPSGSRILQSDPVFFENPETALNDITHYCIANKILSILVEGGAKTLQHFISHHFWDEARIITASNMHLGAGIQAPVLNIPPHHRVELGNNRIDTILNPASHA